MDNDGSEVHENISCNEEEIATGDETTGKKFPVFCFTSFLLLVPFLIFYHLDQSLLPLLPSAAESQGGGSNGNAAV